MKGISRLGNPSDDEAAGGPVFEAVEGLLGAGGQDAPGSLFGLEEAAQEGIGGRLVGPKGQLTPAFQSTEDGAFRLNGFG